MMKNRVDNFDTDRFVVFNFQKGIALAHYIFHGEHIEHVRYKVPIP